MKYTFLVIGLVIGGASGYFLAKSFLTGKTAAAVTLPPNTSSADSPPPPDPAKWPWPDSLDAVVAAPHSHGIIYEDERVRILHVTVAPGQTEPIHSHKWRSVSWAVRSPSFTLYHYALAPDNKLVRTDSFNARLPLNIANKWAPEAPHAVKNTGQDSLVLYRVEFKN